MNKYTIRCSYHTYVTLEYADKFIYCFDNDMTYAEEIIYLIEKRTRMKFSDIPIIGNKQDFEGLRFMKGGWKRKFLDEFPDDKEISAYAIMKGYKK